jgi:hypothetical protein
VYTIHSHIKLYNVSAVNAVDMHFAFLSGAITVRCVSSGLCTSGSIVERYFLQRMVYPERLELDSLIKSNSQSPAGSWCNESQLCDLQEPGQQRHPTGKWVEEWISGWMGKRVDGWMDIYRLLKNAKSVPLYSTKTLGRRGGIAPTHSRPRH